ncbi:redoxin domain-containing protein [Candidatus Desantisbacteria bacterium]|nr:redoxin domain-containing protein [Candidatus Desantisbacteria bacterium]
MNRLIGFLISNLELRISNLSFFNSQFAIHNPRLFTPTLSSFFSALMPFFLCAFVPLCLCAFFVSAETEMANQPAPDFRVKLLFEKNSLTLNKLLTKGDKQNVLVLSFFDTDCKPCLKEMPQLHQLAQKYQDTAVGVYLINIDKTTAEVVEDYVKKNNITLPVLFDPYGLQSGAAYGVITNQTARIPKLFLISKNGCIKKIYNGYMENLVETLSKEIDALLMEEKSQSGKPDTLTILFSNSTNGYLESCNCAENPFGGLVRRATMIKEIRQDNSGVLLLDSGDILPPRQDPLLAKYTMLAMEKMNYDLIALGDQELILGTEYICKEIEEKNLPFYSANLTVCKNKACNYLAPSHLIKEIGSFTVGIISIISHEVFTFFPKDLIKDLSVSDPVKQVQGFVDTFRDKVDLIVVVSHSGYEKDLRLAKQVKGIDVIIGGHSQTFVKNESVLPDTLIVQTGEKGQYLGRLDIRFDKKKKIIDHQYQLLPLTKDIVDDEDVRALIGQYYLEM